MKIGFTCSAFDLLHAGHVMMIQECKRHCDQLIVALHRDPSIENPEKNTPVQSFFEREIQLSALGCVHSIYPYDTEAELLILLEHLAPDIRFIGEEYREKEFTGKAFCGETPVRGLKIQLHHTKRYGFSTSELRVRVRLAEESGGR